MEGSMLEVSLFLWSFLSGTTHHLAHCVVNTNYWNDEFSCHFVFDIFLDLVACYTIP